MGNNSSQPGTSAGSGNVNTYVSRCNIGNFIQNNHLTASTSSTHAPRQNPINNIELAVNTFVGRETELNDIKQLFHQYPVVVIAAMGGMGKTQLARKFASVNANVYRDRYWINAETEEQLLKSFDRLARKVKVEADTDIDTVRDTYRSFTEGATLLIFDNVENINTVYKYLPTRIQLEDIKLHVLVTSRWTEWTSDSSVNCYQLQPLDISVSLQLFQRKFSKICIEAMRDKWEKLAEMLGYLPLALQVATSYIYKRIKHNSDLPMVLADYIKQLREGADGLLNDPLIEYGNRSVYTSMLLTLKQLENKTDDKWKFAVTLVNAAAYMDPDWIVKERLSKLLDNDDNPCILDEALVILMEYSLFNQVVGWGSYAYYTVHRIIQTSIRHNQTAIGTADMHYTELLKYELVDNYDFAWDVLQHVNERASAVINYYKDNPSPTLLTYLVQFKATTALQGVFKLMSRNQVRSLIQQHDWLYRAMESEDLSMAQLLCSNCADINQLNCKEGEPPLHLALRLGNIKIATWMLENGAAPTRRNREGGNALHVASMSTNHEIVSDIIRRDKALVNETDIFGRTPLLSIDYSDNEEDILSTVRVLAKSGADFTAVDKRGNTVVHSAARCACAVAISLFLQLNKDLINIVNEDGETALHVISYYNTNIDDEHILSTIRVLVESGVDLPKVDILGNTALHSAADGARCTAASLFLQLNKDLITSVNDEGETALHVIPYDSKYKDDELILSIIRVLIESGVDLTKVDRRGNTVLHSATRGARGAAVLLFLELNKDLMNIVNEKGQTALHILCNEIDEYDVDEFEPFKETARVLIMNGLSLNTRDKTGCTPLDAVWNTELKDILRQVADECNN